MAQQLLILLSALRAQKSNWRTAIMRYAIAWLLGVPISVLVVIYLFTHVL